MKVLTKYKKMPTTLQEAMNFSLVDGVSPLLTVVLWDLSLVTAYIQWTFVVMFVIVVKVATF